MGSPDSQEKGEESSILSSQAYYTGTQVNYYVICKRKLWLFSRNVRMEQESELVKLGKLVHESSYRRTKELTLGNIAVDFIKKGDQLVLHEVKKTRKMKKAHVTQMLYYLYYLKQKGVEAAGKIDYPKIRKTEDVELTPEREREVENILQSITEILSRGKPPEVEKKRICRKCSYFEFCWI
jgi:CRISPR-associated exonuclease Cas4